MHTASRTVTILILLAGLMWPASRAEAQLGLFNRSKNPAYRSYADPSGRFSIDYPASDWRIVSGGGSVLIGFNEKNGDASLVVDYTKLQLALEASEIDRMFADLEVQVLKERNPTVKDPKAIVQTVAGAPRVMITFTKQGVHGLEQVTQYSIPRGADMYRVVCTTRTDRAEKNAPLLDHMAESFAVSTGGR
jgi:hypothetical protein